MNIFPRQVILLGGGVSIKEGISRGLWNKLKGKFVIGLNYSYNFFDSTMLCYVDKQFYEEESKKEKFQNFPLIVGKIHSHLKILSNTITLKTNDKTYCKDIKEIGIYKSSLVGLFALSLAIYLLDVGQIYLLGFDYGTINNHTDSKSRRITHFYNDIEHRGIGKCNYYDGIIDDKPRADKDFEPYIKETKCHIYNVSPQSNIETFPKLSYSGLFEKMDNETFNQDLLREEIKRKLQ